MTTITTITMTTTELCICEADLGSVELPLAYAAGKDT